MMDHRVLRLLGRRLREVAVLMILAFLAVPQSRAWGREGHRLTALVAQHYLNPTAKEAVTRLLHGRSMADEASWADDFRGEHPETSAWHFVDIPSTAATFNRDRDCPVAAGDSQSPWRDCITDRILYFEGRLGDESLPEAQRAVALKFLIHLIGDVHQPLHTLGDARGGNGIAVSFLGSHTCGTATCNLHNVWDDALIDEEGLSEKKFTAMLLNGIETKHWERLAGGEPSTWANLSHRYAVNAMAPNGALLDHAYVEEETPVVNAQLALGGLRLAHVLNRILGAPAEVQANRVPLPKL
jgi:hypothetical protein